MDYGQRKVAELKIELKNRGAKVTGTKEKLIEREDFTLQLLAKFKTKLHAIKEKAEAGEPSEKSADDGDVNLNSDDWLGHTLCFEEKGAVLAKDASTKGDDWFDIYDPRNPINKRKREKSDKKQKK